MTSDSILLDAALSHLHLALSNICVQVQCHEVGASCRIAMLDAAQFLRDLAEQTELHPEKLEVGPKEGSQEVMDVASRHTLPEPPTDGKFSRNPTALTFASQSRSVKVHDHAGSMGDMLNILLDMFDEKDGGEQCVKVQFLKTACEEVGLRAPQVSQIFAEQPTTSDGSIFRYEWQTMAQKIVGAHDFDELAHLVACQHRARIGSEYAASKVVSISVLKKFQAPAHLCFILSFKSRKRVAWDLVIMVLLVYVTITLPVTFAFNDIAFLQNTELVLDIFFMADLALNFRTTYRNSKREEVWSQRLIALNYMKTWFVLDFVSSMPWEALSGGTFPRVQGAKIFKFGKLFKVFKTLRLGKMMKLWAGSELMERWEEFAWSHGLLVISQGVWLLLLLIVMTHWTACILLACGGNATQQYLGEAEPSNLAKYNVAVYWSMMTLTTVGYGDVGMTNDLERHFAVLCMIIGGTLYGYIIGSVTTTLSERDMNQRTFTERMEVVTSWLNSHYELPPRMRSRIWRHFKEFLSARKAIDDHIILNDLPQQLCTDVSVMLLKESVRKNPIFANLSVGAFSKLVASLAEIKFQSEEVIVEEGDSGSSMFILDIGSAQKSVNDVTRRLYSGDSFGEEMLMDQSSQYSYTVRTTSKCTMFKILRDDFFSNFKNLPQELATMHENYLSSLQDRSKDKKFLLPHKPGHGSLLGGGIPATLAAGFPDAVLERFDELVLHIEHMHDILSTHGPPKSFRVDDMSLHVMQFGNPNVRFNERLASFGKERASSPYERLASLEKEIENSTLKRSL